MNIQKLKTKEKKLRQKQKDNYKDKRAAKIQKIHRKRIRGVVKNSTVLSSLCKIPTYFAIFVALMAAIDRFEENLKKRNG